MKSYHITYIDAVGNQGEDVFFADNAQQLVAQVKEKEWYLLDFKESAQKNEGSSKLPLKSVVIFCRQLGTMIAAGIPIIQSLDMLQSKADNKKTKDVFRSIFEEVQKGNTLSKSMELQKGAFPNLLVNMVIAGEIGGTLDTSLSRMAEHYDKELKLNNKIRTASIYPAVLAVISVTVVLMLVTFVLPSITSMFDPTQMPFSTKIILGFSDFLLTNWLAILIVLFLVIVLIKFALSVDHIRIQYDKLLLRLPIVGKLLVIVYSSRAARAMASLYSSGVQTLEMIETTAKVLGNTYLEDLFYIVMDEVSKGELISKAIQNTDEFDPMLSSMIFIGEESGSLGDILNNTADYFDDEADSAIQRMLALLEPVMLVILGIVIGFIVVSIIQPIFQMYQAIG